MLFTLIIGFALGACTIIFALQNTAMVSLTFLSWNFESSLALVIILASLVGLLLGLLLSIPSIIHKSFQVRKLRKENKGLSDEAETLRQMTQEATDRYTAEFATKPPAVIDLRQTQ